MTYTIKQFNETFIDDSTCLQYMFDQRYGSMAVCPKCGITEPKYYRVKSKKVYECKDCGYQISPLANTIFHKSETSLRSWFYVIFMFSVSKNGVSAKEIERVLGVTYKTAWRMAKLVRSLMEQGGDMLRNNVEVDETYAPSRRHPRKLGHSKKQVIFGAVERQGQVKAYHVKTAGSRVLLPQIRQDIAPLSMVYSDEARVYTTLERLGYSHTTVNHSKLEYVRGNVHTNTIEGFWSQLKRSIDGTYHSVSPKYLQAYVNEFVYRYNHKNIPIFPSLVLQASKQVQ